MSLNAHAQKYYFSKPQNEAWFGAGMSIFRGDIGGSTGSSSLKSLIDYSTLGFSATTGLSRRLKRGFSLRSEFTYSMLKGDDAFSESKTRRERNLHFRTPVFELAAGVQWSVLTPLPRLHKRTPFDVYVHAGASVFYFNPQAMYNGVYYNLRGIGTEGQLLDGGTPYPVYSYSAYGGFGCKYYFKKYQSIGLELTLRRTFTDYIDDVSTNYPLIDPVYTSNDPAGQSITSQMTYRGTADFPAGQVRGNPDLKDNFGLLMITYSRSLNKRPHVTF